MAKQNTQSTAGDVQTLVDPRNYQDVFKTVADMNGRMAGVAIEAGSRSTDIANNAAQETFSNLRDATQMRDGPAEYGQAYSEFMQKQVELMMRTVQSFADVTQKAGSETSEVTSKTGDDIAKKAASHADSAAQTATSAAKKAS